MSISYAFLFFVSFGDTAHVNLCWDMAFRKFPRNLVQPEVVLALFNPPTRKPYWLEPYMKWFRRHVEEIVVLNFLVRRWSSVGPSEAAILSCTSHSGPSDAAILATFGKLFSGPNTTINYHKTLSCNFLQCMWPAKIIMSWCHGVVLAMTRLGDILSRRPSYVTC